LHPNNTNKAKDFEENPSPKKFGFQEYIPRKYENPMLSLSFGSKGNRPTGNDVSDDDWFLRAVTPSSARIA
jgi:hypothetical protein